MKTLKTLCSLLILLTAINPVLARTRILSDFQITNGTESLVAKVNERGDWLIVSPEGAFFNGRKVLYEYQIAEVNVVADLNEKGDWLVLSGKGGYVNGSHVLTSGNVSNTSAVAADINDQGDWVMASSMGAYKGRVEK